MTIGADDQLVHVAAGSALLEGNLHLPAGATGIVLFAHGSGSSRHSPRNQHVAQALQEGSLATLLIDLLTTEEEVIDETNAAFRFDIGLLASRLIAATDWLGQQPETAGLAIRLFRRQHGRRGGIAGRGGPSGGRRCRFTRGPSRPGRFCPGPRKGAHPASLWVATTSLLSSSTRRFWIS